MPDFKFIFPINNGTKTVIEHPQGFRTLALRETYLMICEGDVCCAHLLNALERLNNHYAKQTGSMRDQELHISATQLEHELLGIYSEKTIRQKMVLLSNWNYISLSTQKGKRPSIRLNSAYINLTLGQRCLPHNKRFTYPKPSAKPDLGTSSEVKPQTQNQEHRKNDRPTSEVLPNNTGTFSDQPRNFFRTLSGDTSLIQKKQVYSNLTGEEKNPVQNSTNSKNLKTEDKKTPTVSSELTNTTTDSASLEKTDAHQKTGQGNQSGPHDVGKTSEVSSMHRKSGTSEVLPDSDSTLKHSTPEQNQPSTHHASDTEQVLIRHLGGVNRLKTYLSEAPRKGKLGQTRQEWLTRITPERAEELIIEAIRRASTEDVHKWTALTTLLDEEITGQRTRKEPSKDMALPNSYDLFTVKATPSPSTDPHPLSHYQEGSRHRHISTDEEVTIVKTIDRQNRETIGLVYELSNGKTISPLHLRLQYRPVTSNFNQDGEAKEHQGQNAGQNEELLTTLLA